MLSIVFLSFPTIALAASAASTAGHPTESGCDGVIEITGAGASFPGPMYDYAATEYMLERMSLGVNVEVHFVSASSGYGKSRIVTQFAEPYIIFGATESLLGEKLEKENPTLVTLPVMAG